MNRLMRMTYGRSGSRLDRVLVSGRHSESAVDPLWLKALLLLVWVTIPLLVSRFFIPSGATIQQTVIDISQLTARPPLEPLRQPPPVLPTPEKAAPKPPPPVVKAPEAAAPREPSRPVITRPNAPKVQELPETRPSIVRERSRPTPDAAPVTAARVRRDSSPTESFAERVPVSRSRGGATAAAEPAAPSVAPRRERGQSSGSGTAEAPLSRGGLRRGVALNSLQICPGGRQEEDAVRKVLELVGSRQSCSDGNGEFHFTGTQRISSFNLIIYPARDRSPSNRCEELENAYRCLTKR